MIKRIQNQQFYGLDLSDYKVLPLRNKKIQSEFPVTYHNAHIFAHAFQNAYNVPCQSKIKKTIIKNSIDGVYHEPIVNRLDRACNKFKNDLFNGVFRKSKYAKVATIKKKKEKAFCIQSPEQIAIKCARQAYVRSVIQDKLAVIVFPAKKELSESQKRRKEHQRERREERTLIIKAYNKILFSIFGNIIFKSGWKIGREELKQKLNMPPQCFKIQYMKKILADRHKLALMRSIAFSQKKKAYEREKRERLKVQKYLNKIKKNNYISYRQILRNSAARKQNIFELKQAHIEKYKEAANEGQRLKRLRRRKMRKQKVYYHHKQSPNAKEIQNDINEATVDMQRWDSEHSNLNDFELESQQVEPLDSSAFKHIDSQ